MRALRPDGATVVALRRALHAGRRWLAASSLIEAVLVAGCRATAPPAPRRTSHRVRVLCWHAISDFSGDPVLEPYGVAPERFVDQLDLLARAGWSFVTPEEVVRCLQVRAPVPPRALLVTFDDCYVDLLDAAVPPLEQRDISAVAFAISDAVGGWNTWDQAVGARGMRLLDAEGLRLAEERGVEIGSHGASHRTLPSLSDADMEPELYGSAEALASLGVARPRLFAYPYGSYDSSTPEAVQRAGYVAAFTGDPGVVRPDCDPFRLQRVEILRDDEGWALLVKVAFPRTATTTTALIRAVARRLSRLLGPSRTSVP